MARQLAITIGINQYRYYPERPLRFAERDAALMETFLNEIPFQQVSRFSDTSPTLNDRTTTPDRTNLLLALAAIEQQSLNPDDSLWFFFSGHGASLGNRDYLLPADGNPRLLDDTAIPIDRIIRALRRSNAGNLMLILDMCRNEVPSKAIGNQTATLAREASIITLFSCQPGQQSYELPHLQQGAFTYALLEALRGDCHPQRSHAKDLSRYLRQRLPQLTEKFGPQTPWLIAEPYEKGTQILLPPAAAVPDPDRPAVNLDTLKADAFLAERRQNWDRAAQLWKEVNRQATTAADRDLAVEMLMDIAQKRHAAQATAPPVAPPASPEKASSPPATPPTKPDPTRQAQSTQQPQPSQKAQDDLTSERAGIDYYKLRDLLQQGNWKAADRETTMRMCAVIGRQKQGWLRMEDIKQLPCKDLNIIDRLWIEASNGKFGFSIQKQIWQECGSPTKYNMNWGRFCDRVGWRKNRKWLSYNNLTFQLNKAPEGHLPIRISMRESFPSDGMLGKVFSLTSRLAECNR